MKNLHRAVKLLTANKSDEAADALVQFHGEFPNHPVFQNRHRVAALIGQCAHESSKFTRLKESTYYSTPERIMAVFGRRHFPEGLEEAKKFTKNSKKLANRVYSNRMGNGDERSGDGYLFRGRGYLQLTGRENYVRFGDLLGIHLDDKPDLAAEPLNAWKIAAEFLATQKRNGVTALGYADTGDNKTVTRIVNGGYNGLADRQRLTAVAFDLLKEE